MRQLILLTLLLWSLPSRAAEVEPLIKYGHTSNLFVGCPFRCSDPPEQQQDVLMAGVMITAGKRRAWEMDLVHGVKRIDGRKVIEGSEFEVRLLPGRLRRQ